jgi:hypothetical protein
MGHELRTIQDVARFLDEAMPLIAEATIAVEVIDRADPLILARQLIGEAATCTGQ